MARAFGVVGGLAALAALAASARGEPPGPLDHRRFSIGLGVAFPEVFHAEASFHPADYASVEVGGFVINVGLGGGGVFPNAGVTVHLGGRHAFLVNARAIAYEHDGEWTSDPLFGIGYERLGQVADFRVVAGIILTNESDSEMGMQTVKTVVWPAVSLTWYPRP